ncbi:Copia protein, partial [Durusdinium trenchii]
GPEDVPPSRRPVDDLHDFTKEFIERGYHAEYCNWRDSYLKWRQGDSKGAKGENVESTHIKNRMSTFEYWYPTVSAYNFRRTCAYWIGVLFVEGCLFFLWQPLFEYYWAHPPERMEFWIAKMPILMGTTIFGAGIYMGYVELINMDTDTSLTRPNFFWCDWKGLYRLLQQREEGESDRGDAESDSDSSSSEVYWYQPLSSIAGWLIYVAGAILYQVANVADMFDLEEDQHDYLVGWPLVFGGLSFFLGGCCELIHNRCWATAPNTFVWWSSVCNFVGGIGFWFCACPGIFTGYTTLIGVQGTVLYLIGAILGLCMWRTEQFGLSLISNLNRVHRVGGTQIAVRTEKTTGVSQVVPISRAASSPNQAFKLDDVDNVLEDKLSWRGLSFVVMCTLWGSSSLLGVLTVPAAPWEYESTSRTLRRHLISQEMTSIAHAIGAHLIILLNSVSVHVPSEEPYRLLTLAMRLLVMVMTTQAVMSVSTFLVDEHQ